MDDQDITFVRLDALFFPITFGRFRQFFVGIRQQIRIVVEPIQQVVVFIRLVVAGFIAEQLLHTDIFGSNSPFVAEDFINHVGCCLIGWIIRINECPFSPSMILLSKVPQQKTNIFQVGFIFVVMVARRKERQIASITFFESADESSPNIGL